MAVRDTGNGISDEVIARVERNELPGNKIGLLNVHHRIKLLYGEGLRIRQLNPGTEIEFLSPGTTSTVRIVWWRFLVNGADGRRTA